MNNSFYLKVVGVSYDNRQYIIKKLSVGDSLVLVPEPDNQYDDTAVAVFTEDGEQVGYISRNQNYEIFNNLVRKLGTYDVYVAAITGDTNTYLGVNIQLCYNEFRGTTPSENQVKIADKQETSSTWANPGVSDMEKLSWTMGFEIAESLFEKMDSTLEVIIEASDYYNVNTEEFPISNISMFLHKSVDNYIDNLPGIDLLPIRNEHNGEFFYKGVIQGMESSIEKIKGFRMLPHK